MISAIKRSLLPLLFTAATVGAHAQIFTLHGASIAIGGTGQFTTPLTTNASSGTFNVPSSPGGTLSQTVSNQQQFTTDSAGFLASLTIHPRPWAGIEVNYGLNRYSERYTFNYSSATAASRLSVPVFSHDFTAAYVIHPRHIPFQPFINIGGGYISFLPSYASNQWRGTGLLETGFDIPTPNKHLAFRAEGRALVYRAPNFDQPSISTRGWRVTEEPSLSAVFRF